MVNALVLPDAAPAAPKLTRGQVAASDVTALLRAKNSLLWITTKEELRVESLLFQAAAAAGYVAHFWDVAEGATELSGQKVQGMDGTEDVGAMFRAIKDRANEPQSRDRWTRDVWIMRDVPAWLTGLSGAGPLRQLRNLARFLPTIQKERAQAVIIITTSSQIPDELADHVTVLEWPLPDRWEIGAILDATISSLPADRQATAAPNGTRDAAIDAAIGLTGEEAASCYAKSLVQMKRIDPKTIAQEKKRVIAREKVLEWFDPLPGGLDAVGGLENLKAWLQARRSAYSPRARAFGLPAPKGCLLVGIPGTGKSLTAKAVATAWGVPLLRLDLGALKSKFVGESEGNLRKALRVIEAIGRCVVWIDEIEKALAGATEGGSDGGVSADALGAILSWMQDRQGEAFVFATANDVSKLPPELLRKGRFDEIWFVDLPTPTERTAIAAAALRSHGRDAASVDLNIISEVCDGFTGAEIAALVPDALYAAFADNERQITTNDLVTAARNVVPLKKTAPEKITKLQEWGKLRARSASAITVQNTATGTTGRQIDY